MPLYEFSCRQGHIFEVVRPLAEPVTPCPLCGEPAERAKVSRPYITRYEEQVIENVRLSTDRRDMVYNEKRGFEPVKGDR